MILFPKEISHTLYKYIAIKFKTLELIEEKKRADSSSKALKTLHLVIVPLGLKNSQQEALLSVENTGVERPKMRKATEWP